jgi:hypothetical protein
MPGPGDQAALSAVQTIDLSELAILIVAPIALFIGSFFVDLEMVADSDVQVRLEVRAVELRGPSVYKP